MTMLKGRGKRMAIIGAGASGICAARYAIAAGFDVTVFEKGSKIGGLWCYQNDNGLSAAYRTLHINTARDVTEFSDYKFPAGTQDFPDHWEMYRYLNDYARHFSVDGRIRFNTPIADLRPTTGSTGKWELITKAGEKLAFDSVIVASGHLWDPMHPDFVRDFSGEYLHSHSYREPEPYYGKRVCVVGVGNSACDIASDLCISAQQTVLVARSGVLVVPKMVFGYPVPNITWKLSKPWIPEAVRRRVIKTITWLVHGNMQQYNFKPLEKRAHPTTSSTLINHIAYSRIAVKRGITSIAGRTLHFEDGTQQEFDTLIAATGYRISIPFLSQDIVPVKDNRIDLYKRVVPVEWPGLYFIGFLNSTTALNKNYERQAQWIVDLETGAATLPSSTAMRKEIEQKNSVVFGRYRGTPRHTIEEEHVPYFFELWRERLKGRLRARFKPGNSQPTSVTPLANSSVQSGS